MKLRRGVSSDVPALWAARKAKAERLLTLNAADLMHAWPADADRIVEP
jgi:hypothetical protein